VTVKEAISDLYALRVGTTTTEGDGTPHERPHKPLLLLAAFDLIDEGLATPDHIPWCQELRDRFTARFNVVRKLNDQNNPDLPFRYLAGDGFWLPLEGDGTTPVRREIRSSDLGRVFARFINGFDVLVAIPQARREMREALVARYFPRAAAQLLDLGEASAIGTPSRKVAEEGIEYGRSPAFRRTILEIYDHQCAACGLRIRLPSGNDVSFIDAAHLLPWSEFRNDHPTNGVALCKNHHWAMDRDLIAPTPDHRWKVASILDARRSTGEAELLGLAGKSVLLPNDRAFHPDPEGLVWRMNRLCA
jgi:putative restriction endonuclease